VKGRWLGDVVFVSSSFGTRDGRGHDHAIPL
jgi:hypothetical protein